MNQLDKQYQELLFDIIENGVEKQTRNGKTKSIFGKQIRHKMKEGFPLLTSKKMYWKGIVTELLWFLRGDTNIKYLVDNDCHIWDGDAYKYFVNTFELKSNGTRLVPNGNLGELNENRELLSQDEFINKIKTDDEFDSKWGELGPVYGKQWRSWEKYGYRGVQSGALDCGLISMEDYKKEMYVDQIANLIRDLKTNPDSRRLMVNAWNVGELENMVLPPCHYGFQVYTRELSLEERTQYKKKRDGISRTFAPYTHQMLDGSNIPTRAISLMWNQRSVDTFLGLPFNIASYGLLLEIIAKEVNMVPDELIGNLGDVHLYSNHIEQAKEQIGRKFTEEEIQEHLMQSGMDALMIDARARYIDNLPKKTREPFELPKLVINDEFWNPDAGIIEQINHIEVSDFYVTDYQSHPTIKAPLSN
jgi:thymidylate synthase